MKILVLPFNEMKARQAQFDVIVTVVGPYRSEYPLKALSGQTIIREWMDDISDPKFSNAPKQAQIQNILNAMRPFVGKDVRVCVACQMGISRSSATAFSILCLEEGDAAKAWTRMTTDPRFLQFWPNDLIVAHGDAVLKMGGKMNETIKAHKSTLNFSDCFDSVFRIAPDPKPYGRQSLIWSDPNDFGDDNDIPFSRGKK